MRARFAYSVSLARHPFQEIPSSLMICLLRLGPVTDVSLFRRWQHLEARNSSA